MPSTELDVETLLANARWLRRLARGLAGTDSEADDLVQDTWIAALRTPPDPTRPVRPWLAQVVRNLTRLGRRRSVRRPVAPLDDVAAADRTADDVLASLQLQRRLATLVWELEDPYRNAIMLRFYEGLSSPAIAARLGVPAGTVRWRLSEGVRRLRARLDESESPRWRALALLGVRPRRRPLWPALAVGAALSFTPVAAPVALQAARTAIARAPVTAHAQAAASPRAAGRLAGFVAAGVPALIGAAGAPWSRDELIDDCLLHRTRLVACPLVAVEDWLRGWRRKQPQPPTDEEVARFRRVALARLAWIAAIPEDQRRDRCVEAVDGSLARGDPKMPRDLEAAYHNCFDDPDCERGSVCAKAVYDRWPDRPDR